MSKEKIYNKLYNNINLSETESEELMLLLSEDQLTEMEMISLLLFYKHHEITLQELNGFKSILLNKAFQFSISCDAIDVCGTGGDNKDTFNISTLSALVVASCGYKVAKHGNYSASSVCGSSNVLEYLGYTFSNDAAYLNDQLMENNICFMHAPLFHPALKRVSKIRKELATKTIFNLLGPLLNPCNITHQFIGTNNLSTMRKYEYMLQKTNLNYSIVHNIDGYDEISLTAPFKVVTRNATALYHPNHFKMPLNNPSALGSGKTIESAARIFTSVLNGEGTTEQNNAVIINSAFALKLISNKSIDSCISLATDSLQNKLPHQLFKSLIKNQ